VVVGVYFRGGDRRGGGARVSMVAAGGCVDELLDAGGGSPDQVGGLVLDGRGALGLVLATSGRGGSEIRRERHVA
jgi:hypothetical protein